jgi:uncharacterized membrane protein YtjA (UPF0391 family)
MVDRWTVGAAMNGADKGELTMMIIGVLLAIIVMVTALYGFGYFNSPYIGTFRIAFYFSLIFLVVTLVVAAMEQTNRGYDPTPQSRENMGR